MNYRLSDGVIHRCGKLCGKLKKPSIYKGLHNITRSIRVCNTVYIQYTHFPSLHHPFPSSLPFSSYLSLHPIFITIQSNPQNHTTYFPITFPFQTILIPSTTSSYISPHISPYPKPYNPVFIIRFHILFSLFLFPLSSYHLIINITLLYITFYHIIFKTISYLTLSYHIIFITILYIHKSQNPESLAITMFFYFYMNKVCITYEYRHFSSSHFMVNRLYGVFRAWGV